MDKHVVAAARERLVRGRNSREEKVTSHLWACDPMKADINYDQLSFGPAIEYIEYSSRRGVRLGVVELEYR